MNRKDAKDTFAQRLRQEKEEEKQIGNLIAPKGVSFQGYMIGKKSGFLPKNNRDDESHATLVRG